MIYDLAPNTIINNWKILRKEGDLFVCLCLICKKGLKSYTRDRIVKKTISKHCGCQRKSTKLQVGDTHRNWKILEAPTTHPQRWLALCTTCNETTRRLTYSILFKVKGDHCGCQNKISKIGVGETYGFWKILARPVGMNVQCFCTGCREVTRDVEYSGLLAGRTKSCGCQERRLHKEAVLEKYGVENISQSSKIQLKKKITAIKNGTRVVLADDTPVSEICEKYEVSISGGLKIFHQYGEEFFLEYCKNHSKRIFSTEAAMIDLLKGDFPEIEKYDRQPVEFKLNRKPDFRLVRGDKVLYINIDGLYDHSEIGRTTKGDSKYHLNLAKSFRENNHTIFQFREDELRDSPEIIRSMVKNYFGKTIKLGARSGTIEKVSPKLAKEFFDYNHLMGAHNSSTAFGLYFNNELMCCMSVRKCKNGIDIARFATKTHTSVRGGFSRLLSHIIEVHQPVFIQSFLDMRYSTGISYDKLDFTVGAINLGWKWTDKKNTFNRLQCRANMDERKLSQLEHAEELKWCKIYDAGQAKYVKILKR